MSRRSTTVEVLRARAVELDRKIREVAAKERAKKQADDYRRAVLAGEAALQCALAEPEGTFASTLLRAISARARSQSDRALFGLSYVVKSEVTDPTEVPGDAGSSA